MRTGVTFRHKQLLNYRKKAVLRMTFAVEATGQKRKMVREEE